MDFLLGRWIPGACLQLSFLYLGQPKMAALRHSPLVTVAHMLAFLCGPSASSPSSCLIGGALPTASDTTATSNGAFEIVPVSLSPLDNLSYAPPWDSLGHLANAPPPENFEMLLTMICLIYLDFLLC